MAHINIEIKARCSNVDKIREILKHHNADFKGIDNQKDTYFKSNYGRLKLREGNIENSLIFYDRENKSSSKESKVILYKSGDSNTLKDIFIRSIGIKVVVEKKREIYFIDNVKFHIDSVENLGKFVEIEVIGNEKSNKSELEAQCNYYVQLLDIQEQDLISNSYSDMLSEMSYKKAKGENQNY